MKGIEFEGRLIKNVNISGDRWELFTATMDCTEAANALNKAVKDNFNSGLSKSDFKDAVQEVMGEFSDYGATDTEPRNCLYDIIDFLYK